MFLSDRSRFAGNSIEEDNRLADELERKGMRVIRLSRGDPTVYFPTPRYIIDAYVAALRDGKTTYASSGGEQALKDAVTERYRRLYNLSAGSDDIAITAGISEALLFINSALINKGDTAVLFRPSYPIYMPTLRLHGGRAMLARYDELNGWNVELDALRKSLRGVKAGRVKYMLITNPNNPTGTVLKRSVLEEVVSIANEHGIMLISDEIYDEIVFNNAQFTSVCEVARGMPHVILNGASKVFDSTGFRIGFVIVPEDDRRSQELRERLYNYGIMRLSVNTPAQYAVAAAMSNIAEHRKAVTYMVREIEKRVNYATKMLKENRYVNVVEPNGAFYVFPRVDLRSMGFRDDKSFVDELLKKEGVQVTRGSGFLEPSHFRIVALPPIDLLEYAIDRINGFCRAHSK